MLVAISETKTITGLEVWFGQESLFYLSPYLALALSILWSIYSCVRSHVKGISKKRKYSTPMSSFLTLSFTFISIFISVFSVVLYATPGLGLFQILRHLQGEMYPFYLPFYGRVNTTDTFYFGHAPTIPWSKITRWSYSYDFDDAIVANPPSLTLYVYFSIEQYYFILFCIFALNIILQIIGAKKFTNPIAFKKKSWIYLIIHAIYSRFIPQPMEDWDEEKGTVALHRLRKKFVLKEMLASILLNFTFNFMMLSPLIILGNNHFCIFMYFC